MYNTGDASRGFRNGYVAKVVSNAGATDSVPTDLRDEPQPVAAIAEARSAILEENEDSLAETAIIPPPPSWNVFERAAYARTSLSQPPKREGSILWTR